MKMVLLEAFRSSWLISTFGIILFCAGILILYRNEGQTVHNTLSLKEALNDVVSIDGYEELEQSLEGRIVHLVGPIICGEPLTEPDYNIQVQAVKLRRRVYMYQWVEETVEQSYGDSVAAVETETKTYYYSQQWRDRIIDSRQFYNPHGHKNPEHFPIESGVQVADAVFIGKYELGTAAKEKFTNYQELTSDTRPEDTSIKLHMGYYFHTNDVFNPQIGDLRLLFTFAGFEGEYYTVVGKLETNKIVPHRTSRGVEVLLVYPGEHSASSIFRQERHLQRLRTWSGRFIGWTLIFFAVTCTSKLLTIMLLRTHILAFLAPDRHATGGNLLLSMSLALIIVSVAWIMHRPFVGAGLLLAAATPYIWCCRGLFTYQQLN